MKPRQKWQPRQSCTPLPSGGLRALSPRGGTWEGGVQAGKWLPRAADRSPAPPFHSGPSRVPQLPPKAPSTKQSRRSGLLSVLCLQLPKEGKLRRRAGKKWPEGVQLGAVELGSQDQGQLLAPPPWPLQRTQQGFGPWWCLWRQFPQLSAEPGPSWRPEAKGRLSPLPTGA